MAKWWNWRTVLLLGATLCAVTIVGAPAAAQDGDEPQLVEPEHRLLLVASNVDSGILRAEEGRGLRGHIGGPNRAELQLLVALDQIGEVVVVDDDAVTAEDLVDIDVVVITAATSSQALPPFMLKANVPIIAMKPANWNALGLAKRNADASTPLQRTSSIQVDLDHPIARNLDSPDVMLFLDGNQFPVGRGWVTGSEPIGSNVGTVVASGPRGAAIVAFEQGDALGWPYVDAGDTAVACRVAFASHGSSGASYSTDGLSLFVGAANWALGPACDPGRVMPSGPSLDPTMCRTEPADEDHVARAGEIVDRTPADDPNLSALWIRALQYVELDGDPTVFIGGRFRTAFDADAGRTEDGSLVGGLRRHGVFGCNLRDGTVTDFDVPINIASMTPRGDGVQNERVRALAHDGTWLYVGGKFTLDATALGDDTPAQVDRAPLSLIRVDPRTGEIDTTWRPNLRGSVSALALDGDWLYVGGGVRQADNNPVTRLIRIDVSAEAFGATDLSFTPQIEATIGVGGDDPFASVLALEVVDDTVYFGGSFQTVDGRARNSLAAIDITTGEVTDFAPSIGDNNVNTDPIAQIKDVVLLGDGAILACGDWWVVSPTPGRTWTAYDHDGGEDDPNGDRWFGQRSKIQPRPNQFNTGKFDPATGAAIMVDGVPWGPVTDGGVQACAYDDRSDTVILGGHYEAVGRYVPGFEPADSNDYPASHVAYEKLTAVDGTTGEILPWDPDIDSVRGLDAVAVVPGVSRDQREVIIGGAMTSADRITRESVARYRVN